MACDPFGIHKKIIRKDIRVVSRNLIHRNPELNPTGDHKVCSRCWKLLEVAKTRVSTNILMHHFDDSKWKKTIKNVLESEYQISDQYFIGHCTWQHPNQKRKLSKNPNYAKKRFKKVKFTMKRKFEMATMQSLHPVISVNHRWKLLNNWKKNQWSEKQKLKIYNFHNLTKIMEQTKKSLKNFIAQNTWPGMQKVLWERRECFQHQIHCLGNICTVKLLPK